MSEHIFVPLAGSTAVRCSCGKEYGTTAEAQQHQWWEMQLEIADRQRYIKLEANPKSHTYLHAPKPNATLSNLEGDLGSSHMQGTPKAQGHEADNLSAESAGGTK